MEVNKIVAFEVKYHKEFGNDPQFYKFIEKYEGNRFGRDNLEFEERERKFLELFQNMNINFEIDTARLESKILEEFAPLNVSVGSCEIKIGEEIGYYQQAYSVYVEGVPFEVLSSVYVGSPSIKSQ